MEDKTREEHNLLLDAEYDITSSGATDKKCPRCGNDIVLEENCNSYVVRCKTDDCISAEFRCL